VTPACAAPLGLVRIVDHVAGDAGADGELVEAHLMGCAACAVEAEQIVRIARALATALPPVVSAAQAALRAGGLVLEDNAFAPGTRTPVVFRAGIDLMIHTSAASSSRAPGACTSPCASRAAARSSPTTTSRRSIPASDEIRIACQRHFASLPPGIRFDVRVHEAGAPPQVATYLLPRTFDRGQEPQAFSTK
jgi:hypothetical protein